MTRKRFIKLLMSTCTDRNWANRVAADIRRHRGASYADVWNLLNQRWPE